MLKEQGPEARSRAAHCCADGANLGGKSRVPACSRTVRASAHARFICLHRLRRSGCGVFLSACRAAPKKKIRSRCLAPRTISHRCHEPSATSEAARNSLCLDCVTECRNGTAPHKRENACGCAYRVQGAELLCILRGKTGWIRKCSPSGGADGLVLHTR